jgi:hypothetical protein
MACQESQPESEYRRAFYAVYWPARARGATPAEATALAEAATVEEHAAWQAELD